MFEIDYNRIAILFLIGVWVCIAATFPAFPIDETRYLTVAWEMRTHHLPWGGNWILPTLNGAPYSHKPPLLFWLINLMWLIFGPYVWSARIISVLTAIAVVVLTGRLATRLFPNRPLAVRLAPMLALASPFFMVYGGMIMFDFLLYAGILASLLYLWRAGHENSMRPWIWFGVARGFAVLAKGPVILVHTLGPALLAPFLWLPETTQYGKGKWYGRVVLAILIATAIGLAWAVPAALIGGPEFAHMIFWGQSAGRMVESFAHRRPFWFYLPFVPLFILPWLFTRPFWQGMKDIRVLTRTEPGLRFILSWIVPAFLAFSLISGKQLHYIVPLISGFAIIAAVAFDRVLSGRPDRQILPLFIIPYAFGFIALAAAAYIPHIAHHRSNQTLFAGVAHFESWPFIAGLLAAAAFTWLTRRRFEGQVLAMIACLCLVLGIFTVEGRRHVYKFYDLAPLAKVLSPYGGHPIAYVDKYAGEIGFVARLTAPVQEISRNDISQWFTGHPDGFVVMRHDNYETLPQFNTVYTQAYRGDQRISVLKP
jgi:4-amino-4-deoxy-L-arabinose transferase-like glycosyltransferase